MSGRAEHASPFDGEAAPKELGRYKLCFELASGGMANVYLARVEGPGGFEKLVALKIPHPHLAREEGFVEMFLDEARLASRVDHPNVCTVFDFGEIDQTYFLAMEFVQGQTMGRLARAIRSRSQMSGNRLAAIAAATFSAACEGLHAAHELRGTDGDALKVVHRDISPSNLFVSYDGSVRVMDFGVASAADHMHHTRTGQVKGNFAYMAPERLGLIEAPTDRRSDIYSMGCVLWEFVAGHRLFKRENDAATFAAILAGQTPPPSRLRRDLPREMDGIVLKALARDPKDRFATARDMGRALSRFSTRLEQVSMAEIADLMEELFEPERVRGEQLVSLARQLDVSHAVPSVAETPSATSYPDGVPHQFSATLPDVRAPFAMPVRAAVAAGTGLLVLTVLAVLLWPSLPGVPGTASAPEGGGRLGEPKAEEPDSAAVSAGADRAAEATESAAGDDLVLDQDDLEILPVAPRAVRTEGPSGPAARPPEASGRASARAADPRTTRARRARALVAKTPTAPSKRAEASGGRRRGSSAARRARRRRAAAPPDPPARRRAKRAPQTQAPARTPTPPRTTPPRTTPPRTTPPRTTAPPRTSGRGFATVITPGGWADVYQDQTLLGRTPARFELPAGRHDLRVRLFGRPPDRRVRVNIRNGRNARIVIRITSE